MSVILPIIAVSLVNMSSYFLPPDSGERMGVLITLFLSLAVLFNIVSGMLPTSGETTYIGIYLIAVMLETGRPSLCNRFP